MAADLISAMQDAGGTLAQTLTSNNAVGSRTRYGTVKKNNGTTLDVELCGATLAAVPMLTTCVGAAAGDRCILTIDGALVTVTGIIANAGNAPYVKLVGSTYNNMNSGSKVSVNVPAGWTFLCWLQPVSNGFVGSAYINPVHANNATLWIYANGTGSWTCTAVLVRRGVKA